MVMMVRNYDRKIQFPRIIIADDDDDDRFGAAVHTEVKNV